MIKPYYPNDQDQQLEWWQNFGPKFGQLFEGLGFTDADDDRVQAVCSWAVYLLDDVRGIAEGFSKGTTGYVRSIFYSSKGSPAPGAPVVPAWPVPPASTPVTMGIDELRQEIVAEIKAKPNYDPAVHGALLRIEPTGEPFNPLTYQAVVRDVRATGPVTVRLKLGKANGAIAANEVRMRRKGTTAWTVIGRYTSAEVIDTTPLAVAGQPEVREYQAQGVIKDALIGLPSDIETVTVSGSAKTPVRSPWKVGLGTLGEADYATIGELFRTVPPFYRHSEMAPPPAS